MRRRTSPKFNGPEYRTEADHDRLRKQHDRVREFMNDGKWRTLAEIEKRTGDPPASISAQLRHLRKPRFGSWHVLRRPRGDRKDGLFEYRLVKNVDDTADDTGTDATPLSLFSSPQTSRRPNRTLWEELGRIALRLEWGGN